MEGQGGRVDCSNQKSKRYTFSAEELERIVTVMDLVYNRLFELQNCIRAQIPAKGEMSMESSEDLHGNLTLKDKKKKRRFKKWLKRNETYLSFVSSILLAAMAIIVSLISIQVGSDQNRIAEKTLYPHFQVWFHTQDDNSDGYHDTAYINVTNYGGNFYSVDCRTISYFDVQPLKELSMDAADEPFFISDGDPVYIPVWGLFVLGLSKSGAGNAFTRVCDSYISYNLMADSKPQAGFCINRIRTFVQIEYQNIDGDIKNDYYDANTGKKLSNAEGEYYFRVHSPKYDGDVLNYEIVGTDDKSKVLAKIEYIIKSKEKEFEMLKLQPYQ